MKLRYSPLIKQSVRLGEHINPHKKLSWKQANKLKNVVNRSKKQSDFGADLLEYRRLTSVYGGLTKSSFTKLSKAAFRAPGLSNTNLLYKLEARLDTCLYRLGFANSFGMAKQLVNHKFVQLNGRTHTVSSYELKPGDIVTLTARNYSVPAWIKTNPCPPVNIEVDYAALRFIYLYPAQYVHLTAKIKDISTVSNTNSANTKVESE